MRDILPLVVAAIPDEESAATTTALAWTLAAGPSLSARAECLEVRDGVLWLRAADAQAQAAINSISGDLCRALNRTLPSNLNRPPLRRIAFLP
ncbi:MAG TPA: DciA family protein [Terriglobales bacterium]|nr:DciA family protein [Terriglobales bacterium]